MPSGRSHASEIAFAVARMVIAIYVGALLIGPPYMGYWGLIPYTIPILSNVVTLLLMLVVIPAVISGVIAGRRLSIYAGPLAFLWVASPYLTRSIVTSPSVLMLVWLLAMFSGLGWAAGRLSVRWPINDQLSRTPYCPALATVLALLFVYTVTFGKPVATARLTAKLKANGELGSTSIIKAYTAGPYIQVEHKPFGPASEYWTVYNMDPTGRVLVSTEDSVLHVF